MLFKNPTLLYGLLFLLIPIIVHLFQLRKFKKVLFSNVAFLKPLLTQTRKSRTLKKWLTLLSRLLAVACIVLAFAQPYLPKQNQTNLDENLIIYLDNSYSLQAKGANGKLYQTAVKDLIEKLPSQLTFSLFTNDRSFQRITKQEIANELITSPLSSNQLKPDEVLLKASSLKNQKNTAHSLLWISDFQKMEASEFPAIDDNWNTRLVKLKPVISNNISIDSAYLDIDNAGNSKIQLLLSSNFDREQPATISLFNDNVLLAKTSTSFSSNSAQAEFTITDVDGLNGSLQIEDDGLQFDNKLFISTANRENIKILHVNDTDQDFLKRIYTDDEFDYTVSRSNNLNYNTIKDQQVIVINEVATIAPALASELNNFVQDGNILIIIPPVKGVGYNSLQGISDLQTLSVEKRITTINFDHPVLRNVFSKRITNFQYPRVDQISFSNASGDAILSYDDGSPFLVQTGNTFYFTAALNEANSNFQNSPLVVPVLYKLGLKNTTAGILYYSIGARNEISFQQQLEQDQIIELQIEDQQYIPEQRAYNSFVTIITNEELNRAGNYKVMLEQEPIGVLSFNAYRNENKDSYYSNEELQIPVMDQIAEFVQELDDENNRLELWKLFVAGALLFLVCELLILKLLK